MVFFKPTAEVEEPPMTANIHLTIEAFPTLCVPQADGHQMKIYNIHPTLPGIPSRRKSMKAVFSNSLQKHGVVHSTLALSRRHSVSTDDLLTVRSYQNAFRPALKPKDKSTLDSKRSVNRQKKVTIAKKQKQNIGKKENVSEELYRISFPCPSGCANCAFSGCLGPVKVFISQFSQPKPTFVREIADGRGRAVIPRSRRREIRGMVYDKDSHSLHPPLPRRRLNDTLEGYRSRRMFY